MSDTTLIRLMIEPFVHSNIVGNFISVHYDMVDGTSSGSTILLVIFVILVEELAA